MCTFFFPRTTYGFNLNAILQDYHFWLTDAKLLAFRDKLELKAVNDGSVSYAALERKAALYDKLVRGELSDEEDKEMYCVDFFRKGLEQEESKNPQGHETSTMEVQVEDGNDDELHNMRNVGLGQASGTMDRSEHKRFVM